MLLDLLNVLQGSWQEFVTAARAASTRAPGRPLTQALVVGALLWMLTWYLTKKRPHLPPGPRSLPLLGHLRWMNSDAEQFYVTLSQLAREKYGPIMTVYLGPKRCITLNDLDSITEALVQKGDSFAGRPQLHSLEVITEGYKSIVFSDYSPAWQLHRKIATKALKHYMTRSAHLDTIVQEVVAKVANKMAAERGPFDPHMYNSTLMFLVFIGICFGEIRSFNDPSIQRLIKIFDTSNREVGNGVLEDIVPLLKYWPTKRFQRIISMIIEFYDFIEKNIEKHRQRFSSDHVLDVTDSILLAQSIIAHEESAQVVAMFTNVHIRQTISDVFGDGVDASRLTLDWALLYMAGHPEIQKRAQAEIDAARGTELSVARHRGRLQYTQAVLRETMRLACAAPIGALHKALGDTTVGQYDVPKGTMVLVNIWAVTHDPTLWEEPARFKPERFLDDQGKLKPAPKAWIPFSAGRRMCLGESLAQLMLLLLLASFLKRFSFTLPQDVTYDPSYQVGMMAVHAPKPYKVIATPR